MSKLSIIIPVYNEKDTLLEILRKIKKVKLPVKKEIILVDDFSTDGTREIVKKLGSRHIKIFFHDKNYGKGMAIKTGLKNSTGDIIIIQDADLEYDPQDYRNLIKPIINGKAEVVYGSRLLADKKNKHGHLSFYIGGRIVTIVTNMLFFSRLTDEPTCYKTFKAEVIKKIRIHGNRFEWEPEVTAKILKKGIRIHEVPIAYFPRDKEHGKKINWKDGLQAIWTLVKYRFED